MNEEDYEEYDENEVETHEVDISPQELDPWDMVGVALTTIAGVASVFAQGLNMAAQGCWRHAQYRRYLTAVAEAKAQEEAYRAQIQRTVDLLGGVDQLILRDEP